MTLLHCTNCDFDFFDIDPTAGLAADKLDVSRLQAAGLDVPALEKDFANGLRQSQPHVDAFIGAQDAGRNILEVGCSWGYFLKLAADRGCRTYGLEVNRVRAQYVSGTLGMPCYTSLEECEAAAVRFRQIFLFYVLEYIPDPVDYLARLVRLLEPGGQIVLITPNLADALKDLWRNEAFGAFFYDEHAVNYFTPRSVRNLISRLPAAASSVTCRQGYSAINHLSWYLTNSPRTTGMVGGDYYVRDIAARLKDSPNPLGAALAGKLMQFDAEYRKLLEENDFGNQICIVLKR
jgi:2-polyprenyl-3-methyl-5-hydroxy-6-metoxy-1,4-benzoquinol methylase